MVESHTYFAWNDSDLKPVCFDIHMLIGRALGSRRVPSIESQRPGLSRESGVNWKQRVRSQLEAGSQE